jgi:hypothetical protein
MALGYVGFGAGGFFGEKRRVAGPEFSLAAKLTKAIYTDASGDRVVGFAAKLGDCSENGGARPMRSNSGRRASAHTLLCSRSVLDPPCDSAGSWAEHDVHAKLPTKFIVSSETDRAASAHTLLSPCTQP